MESAAQIYKIAVLDHQNWRAEGWLHFSKKQLYLFKLYLFIKWTSSSLNWLTCSSICVFLYIYLNISYFVQNWNFPHAGWETDK